MGKQNLDILKDTLSVIENGSYEIDGRKIPLKLSKARMERVKVFLPEDIARIHSDPGPRAGEGSRRCIYECMDIDSFTLAAQRCSALCAAGSPEKVLVLNLASPVHPGGGVRKGARAQEEDLCRRSTLLCSLESADAEAYYEYNRNLHTMMGSDAIIITPEVEVFKSEGCKPLPESFVVSVMTCAAPSLRYGLEGLSHDEYAKLLYKRIFGMLKVAVHEHYRNLILGAFGCGAFRNDARIVAGIFRMVFQDFEFDGIGAGGCFDRIDFAVLCSPKNKYNYNEFARAFSGFKG